MFYARACDSKGEDICGGDNLLCIDGRFGLTRRHNRAADFARGYKRGNVAGFNIYRTLRDSKPLYQCIFIKTH